MGELVPFKDKATMTRQDAIDWYRLTEANIEQGIAELKVSGKHLKSFGRPPLSEMFDVFPDDSEGA